MNEWFAENSGLRECYRGGRRRVPRDPRSASATTTPRTWISAAPIFARASSTSPSATCAARSSSAIPLPGLAYNYLACIAHDARRSRGDDGSLQPRGEDRSAALRHPERATRRAWFAQEGPGKDLPLELGGAARLPAPRAHRAADAAGSLARRFRGSGTPPLARQAPSASAEGAPSQASTNDRTRLKVVSSP